MEYKEKRELHLHLLHSLTDYIKVMCMFNKPLRRKIWTSAQRQLHQYISIQPVEKVKVIIKCPGFANFIGEWSHCDFYFTNFRVILEYLESSITTTKAIFRLSSMWSWHVYTIVRDTRSSCGGPLTWKAQIPFDRNLPSSCFVVQYNSLILMI